MRTYKIQIMLAFLRGFLAMAVLLLFGKPINKYADSVLSKTKLLGKIVKKDKKIRELIVEKYWLVGLLITSINLFILLFINW